MQSENSGVMPLRESSSSQSSGIMPRVSQIHENYEAMENQLKMTQDVLTAKKDHSAI
jgi:hypothetical protein